MLALFPLSLMSITREWAGLDRPTKINILQERQIQRRPDSIFLILIEDDLSTIIALLDRF